MTTVISTGASVSGGAPVLVGKIEGFKDTINGAFLLRKDDGVLTVCDDKSVRVWLKRDTGMYWPSIHHIMPSVCLCLDYHEETGRLFVGLASGTVSEFAIADDFNSIKHQKDFYSHTGGVTALRWCVEWEWVVSVGKDKQIVWECSETGRRLGAFTVEGWCTCLEFDAAAKYAFIGDYSGSITVLKLGEDSCESITKFSAHTGSIRSLSWDVERSQLYSASNDSLIIVWDIGGRKGTALELNGHAGRVTAVRYSGGGRVLFSGGDGGRLVAWDMAAPRQETPAWATSDNCQRCDAPFFWNFKAMWDRKVVGLRQHHCRVCGAAVCWNCSQSRLSYPRMGYELDVRVCPDCKAKVDAEADGPSSADDKLKFLAAFHDVGHSVLGLDLDEIKARLLSYGTDRILKIWDVASIIRP